MHLQCGTAGCLTFPEPPPTSSHGHSMASSDAAQPGRLAHPCTPVIPHSEQRPQQISVRHLRTPPRTSSSSMSSCCCASALPASLVPSGSQDRQAQQADSPSSSCRPPANDSMLSRSHLIAESLTDSPLYSSGPPKAYVMKCTCSTVLMVFTLLDEPRKNGRSASLRAGRSLSPSVGSEASNQCLTGKGVTV